MGSEAYFEPNKTEAVDISHLDQFKQLGFVDITETDLKSNHEKLKARIRVGFSIHSSNRHKLFIRLMMNGKPLRDGQYVPDVPLTIMDKLPREKWACGDKELFGNISISRTNFDRT